MAKEIIQAPDWEASLKGAFKPDFQLDDLINAILSANCSTDKRRMFGRPAVPMPFQIQLAVKMILLDPLSSPKTKEQIAVTITERYLTEDWAAHSLILIQPLSNAIIDKLDRQMHDRDSRTRIAAAEVLHATGKNVTKDLCLMLNDPINEVRVVALRLLSTQVEDGDKQVEDVLIANLTGGTGELGEGALKILTRMASVGDETLQLMIRFLDKSDEGLRDSIAGVLHRMGRAQNKVITLMIRSLGETTETAREALVDVLHRLAEENSFVEQTLIRFLRHGQPATRYAIIESIDKIIESSKEVIKCICERLHDPAPEVRSVAIARLTQVVKTEEWVQPLLCTALESRNQEAKRAAALVLIESGVTNSQSAAIMTSWLDDPDWELRHCAIHALNSEKDEQHVIRTLCIKLSDENEHVRETAVELISARMEKSDTSFTTLLSLIYDESVEIRFAAFLALRAYHDKSDKRLITSVCEKLNDESGLIRAMGAKLLGESGTKSSVAVKALIARLKDDQPKVREGAAIALGRLGICSQKILKPLEQAAKSDQDEDVRRAADDALRSLNSAEAGSELLLGQTITIEDTAMLERLFKTAKLFKPSVVAPVNK